MSFHLDSAERSRVDAAVAAGAAWLATRIDATGTIVPTQPRVCSVAASGLGLWALAESGRDVDELAPVVRHLRAYAQRDGGVYDPARGLAVCTSGVAAAGLRACAARVGVEVDDLVREAELFTQRGAAPESAADDAMARRHVGREATEVARRLLASNTPLEAAERRAAEFLVAVAPGSPAIAAQLRAPRTRAADALDAFSYDDARAFVYLAVRPDQQVHLRAMAAIRRDFTLDHNPDLARCQRSERRGDAAQGLYHYYLLLVKVLAATGSPQVTLADGRRVDWVRASVDQLLRLQTETGAWVNRNGRWWEDDPVIVTSYALLALRACRDAPPARRSPARGD